MEAQQVLGTSTTIHSPASLYNSIPCGSDTLVFDRETGRVAWTSRRCGCCNSQTELGEDTVKSARLCREPATCARVTRDGILSFIFGGFFHFFPAVLYGPEKALGTESEHRSWGIVWFGLFPIWWLLFWYLRPWGLQCGEHFVPLATRTLAGETRSMWLRETTQPPAKVPALRPATVLGTSIAVFLVLWGFYTADLISKCNDMGCCLDDEKTLDECIVKWNNRS